MRSRFFWVAGILASALVACAKGDQVKQCYPVASWTAPVFKCEGTVPPPPPPVVENEPEPPPPEPEPEPEPPAAEIKADRIELNQKVNFEAGKAVLVPESRTLLDEVVKIMNDHPEIERVRIEGHTSSEGGEALNRRLSDQRAKAVRAYLVSQGVSAKRLDAKGFGQAKPIADNSTFSGREQNRRVEIHIVKRK
jgi:outer membrane protein OmpA-like peptidoglycan-associated protein